MERNSRLREGPEVGEQGKTGHLWKPRRKVEGKLWAKERWKEGGLNYVGKGSKFYRRICEDVGGLLCSLENFQADQSGVMVNLNTGECDQLLARGALRMLRKHTEWESQGLWGWEKGFIKGYLGLSPEEDLARSYDQPQPQNSYIHLKGWESSLGVSFLLRFFVCIQGWQWKRW